jgi:hypothetical protein
MSSAQASMAPSAGDHIWRQVRLDLYPGAHGVHWSVHLRKHKGTDLVWKRNLSAGGIGQVNDKSLETGPAILRAVAEALLEVADEMDRLD